MSIMSSFRAWWGGTSRVAGYTAYNGHNATNAANFATNMYRRTGRKADREMAQYLNALDQDLEVSVVSQIFSSRFTWSGDAIAHIYTGYIEQSIFNAGFVVAHLDPEIGLVILPASVTSYSYMNTPNRFVLTGRGYSKNVGLDECVVIKDNDGWFVPRELAERKASIIADLGRAIEVYTGGMKKPVILTGTDKDALTNEIIAEQLLTNSPYIIARTKGMRMNDTDEVKVHNTSHNASDLMGLVHAKQNLSNELLSKIGVSASTVHKSQYTSESELDKQDIYIDLLCNQAERNRLEAIQKMKEMWGIDVMLTNNMSQATQYYDDGGEAAGDREETEDEDV